MRVTSQTRWRLSERRWKRLRDRVDAEGRKLAHEGWWPVAAWSGTPGEYLQFRHSVHDPRFGFVRLKRPDAGSSAPAAPYFNEVGMSGYVRKPKELDGGRDRD